MVIENKTPESPVTKPAKKKRGLSFWLALVFGILLSGSLGFNLLLIFALAFNQNMSLSEQAGDKAYQEKYVDGDESSDHKILRISVNGILLDQESSGGFFGQPRESIVDAVLNRLQQATDDQEIKAIILEVNSPGGGITESDRIHRAIVDFKQNRPGVKIVVLMKNVAASGGYYISAPADYIMAHQTTITGSIGVISQFFNFEKLFEKIGVKTTVIKSKELKDIGSPYRPMSEKEQVLFKKIIDEMYARFIDVIAEGRQGKLSREEILDLATGMIYTGRQALKLKLVDGLGYWSDALDQAKTLAKVRNARVIEYSRQPLSFFQLLTASRQLPPPQIQLPSYADLLEGKVPKFMYLWMAE